MISILMGTAFVFGGLWGLVHWFPDLIFVLKGIGPISLIFGGIVALMAGFNSFQKNRSNDKPKS